LTFQWYPKDFFDKISDPDEAAEMEKKYSPEEIAKQFSPEDVCLQESCNAAEYRLFRQHVNDVDLSKIESWLTLMHRVKKFKMDRAEKAKRLSNQYTKTDCVKFNKLHDSLEKLVHILVREIEKLDEKMSIARFLFDRYKIFTFLGILSNVLK
jgi:hypothetical protein